jgi:hypothetical protein
MDKPNKKDVGDAIEQTIQWGGEKPGVLMNWVVSAEYMDPETGKVEYFVLRNDHITPATSTGLFQYGLDSEEWEEDN